MRRFVYRNATTIAEAASLLRAGDAALLAGGTDLINLLKMGALKNPPAVLVNIKSIAGLNSIKEDAEGLRIGALATLADIASSRMIQSQYPTVAGAAASASSPALREMSTLGGNLCQQVQCWYFRRSLSTGTFFDCLRKGGRECYAVAGDNRYHAVLGARRCFAVCPSDAAVALAALNASIVTTKRSLPLDGFFGELGNALQEDEIIVAIHVPAPGPGTKQVFSKFALRPSLDFALASVALALTTERERVSHARIMLGGVAPGPFRAGKAEDILLGSRLSGPLAEAAAAAALGDSVPLSDNEHKIQIARALLKRALLKCKELSAGDRAN